MAFPIIPVAMGVASLAAGLFGQRKQRESNMAIAKYQTEADQAFMREMNEYNTPANQMRRFQEAGLNPHLIYGQGNPGNQSAPVKHADISPTDYQSLMNALPLFNQTAMTQAQVQATNARTEQTYAMTALNELQAQVLAKNPLLDEGAFKAIIDGLKSTATLKQQEIGLKSVEMFYQEATVGLRAAKIEREIELLEQRFQLGELDSRIKAEVINSKQFQNAILEVQKKFFADGELGSQQILQFIQLLLMKIL